MSDNQKPASRKVPRNPGGPNARTVHVLGLLVVALWAMVFTALVAGNRFTLFLLPSFKPFLLLAVGFLAAGFIAKFALGHSHGHDVTLGATWIRTLILLLPLFYLSNSYGESLGSHAFNKRRSFEIPGVILNGALDRSAGLDNKEHDGKVLACDLLQIAWNSVHWIGRKVRTTGQVTWDDKVPEGHFVVFRFVITCCVADSQPVAFLIRWEKQQGLKEDAWVELTGTIEAGEVAGRQTIVIRADSDKMIQQPEEIYIFNF